MKAVSYSWINDDIYQYTAAYFTHNKWVDDDTFILARAKNERVGAGDYSTERTELVCISLKNNTRTVIADDANGPFFFAYNGKVYYTAWDELKVIDNGISKVLFENCFYRDKPVARLVHPHITNDGSTLGVYVQCKGEPSVFITLNEKSGEIIHTFKKGFDMPSYRAEHGMLCPTNPNLMYFCHEDIKDRMWLCEMDTGNYRHIAPQRITENGKVGDIHGHEMWAPDGKGLYFVKYASSPLKPTGICYVDAVSGKSEVLYSKYKYWHAGVSLDGRYILADTQLRQDMSEVVMIDRQTGEEQIIDIVKTTGSHPTHPHPQLSPDNKKLIYSTLDDKNRVAVKLAYIEFD